MDMVTKANAKAAWQTIMMFSMMNSDKDTIAKKDVTMSMQKAILTLNEYFTEEHANDETID